MKILKSDIFNKWYKKLDLTQKIQIDVRLSRILIDQHFGVIKQLGNIFELKFKSGTRVYCAKDGDSIVLLLNGGDKNTKREQNNDIKKAQLIFEEYCDGK